MEVNSSRPLHEQCWSTVLVKLQSSSSSDKKDLQAKQYYLIFNEYHSYLELYNTRKETLSLVNPYHIQPITFKNMCVRYLPLCTSTSSEYLFGCIKLLTSPLNGGVYAGCSLGWVSKIIYSDWGLLFSDI